MTTIRRLVTVVATVLTMGVPLAVRAQEGASGAKAAPTSSPAKTERKKSAESKPQGSARPKKVVRVEELKVEGRIQKPQAMFLMPRANLNFDDLDKGESFLPKVTEPLQDQPF